MITLSVTETLLFLFVVFLLFILAGYSRFLRYKQMGGLAREFGLTYERKEPFSAMSFASGTNPYYISGNLGGHQIAVWNAFLGPFKWGRQTKVSIDGVEKEIFKPSYGRYAQRTSITEIRTFLQKVKDNQI